MKPILVFLSICFSYNISFCQLHIKGNLVDKNNEPIIFAHVFLKSNQGIGTVTDEGGQFSLVIPRKSYGDTIVCTSLAYETLYTPIEDLPDDIRLVMETSSYTMDELTIVSDEYLKHLFIAAIRNIQYNYPNQNHQQRAYYQEYTISNDDYSELIEADIIIKNEGFGKEYVEREMYINQLRKTNDDRMLREDLKNGFKSIITYDRDPLVKRSFSNFHRYSEDMKRFTEDMELEVYSSSLAFHSQQVVGSDTIINVKIGEPFFKYFKEVNGQDTVYTDVVDLIFGLVSINKKDKAIVQIQHGNIWYDKGDWNVYKYRKINGLYYPVYMKNVFSLSYNQETETHYNVQTLLVYDNTMEEEEFTKTKRRNRVKTKKDIREYKYKYDLEFWQNYLYPIDLPSIDHIKLLLNKKEDLDKQFRDNQKRTMFAFPWNK